MTLGQIALKYMLNILTGPCKEAVEWLSCSCKVEQVDCFWCRGTSIKLLFVTVELLCSYLIIELHKKPFIIIVELESVSLPLYVVAL